MSKATFLHVRVESHEVKSLDGLRRLEEDIPTRSEMMRRLISRASESNREEAKRSARR